MTPETRYAKGPDGRIAYQVFSRLICFDMRGMGVSRRIRDESYPCGMPKES